MKQIAALPLGGRIKMDPWSDRIEISKAKSVPLLTARDKMPFEITPIFPYLTRVDDACRGCREQEHQRTISFTNECLRAVSLKGPPQAGPLFLSQTRLR